MKAWALIKCIKSALDRKRIYPQTYLWRTYEDEITAAKDVQKQFKTEKQQQTHSWKAQWHFYLPRDGKTSQNVFDTLNQLIPAGVRRWQTAHHSKGRVCTVIKAGWWDLDEWKPPTSGAEEVSHDREDDLNLFAADLCHSLLTLSSSTWRRQRNKTKPKQWSPLRRAGNWSGPDNRWVPSSHIPHRPVSPSVTLKRSPLSQLGH